MHLKELPFFENTVKNQQKDIYILSWNINGIRAIEKNGFIEWIHQNKPDILCLQETKVQFNQLNSNLRDIDYYHSYWNSAEKKGYSGTSIFSREEPLNVEFGLGNVSFDNEGRVIIAEYPDFILINCYFPNGGEDNCRVTFKAEFHNAFLSKCNELRHKNKAIIFCGDVNIAHTEIDLANPKSNKNKTGFLKEEREWIDMTIENDYIDTFRYFYPKAEKCYTWWSYMNNARNNNSGWRIDYFFIEKQYINRVKESFIMPDVIGSDHCPVGIKLQTENRRFDKFKNKTHKLFQQTSLF